MVKNKRVFADSSATEKRPSARFPVGAKQPLVTAEGAAPNQIAWRFGKVDYGGDWPWSAISLIKLREVVGKLSEFEKSTWAQLAGPKHHRIDVGKLAKAARKRLEEIKQDDTDSLWSLRLAGKERVWGILHGGHVFYFLWWDPEHTVCPALLKHT